jgi:hypothetical protein
VGVLRGLFLLLLGAGLALAAERVLLTGEPAGDAALPPIERTDRGPGDQPLVWLDGTLDELGESELALREGDGPVVRLQRLAQGATRFLRVEGDAWRPLSTDDVVLLEPGNRACVEALLDGRTLVALRVFLGVDCGPAA